MADEFDPYYTWLGIRPEEQPADHYRLIGLRQFEDHADVISNALDQKMQFLRTLQVGKRAALSQKLLNEISAAGGCLLDKQKKLAYDNELKAKEAAKQAAAQARAAAARPLPMPAMPIPAPFPLTAPPVALPPSPRPVPIAVQPQPVAESFSPAPRMEFPGLNTSSRKTSSWKLPMLLVGGVLGLVVVGVGVMYISRLLEEQKKVAATRHAQGTSGKHVTKPSPEVTPGETKPPPEVSPETTSPESPETDPAEPTTPPKTKTPVTSPGPKTTTPPPGTNGQTWWKDPSHVERLVALQIGTDAYAEFPDSASRSTLATPLTAEFWLRLHLQSDKPVQILGTLLGGEGAVPKGWALFAKRLTQGDKQLDQLYVEFWKPTGDFVGYPVTLPSAGEWHHIAFVFEPEKPGHIYIDGKKPLDFPAEKNLSNSQRNLRLGSEMQLAGADFKAEFCGLRVSESVRYAAGFSPPSPLNMQPDAATFAALDCRLLQPTTATSEKPYPWLYGMGKFDDKTNQIVGFQPLRYGTSRQWQGGTQRPDNKVGYIALDPVGGHPGNQPSQAAVRRWVAPQDGEVSITGHLRHFHTMRAGDGIHARIVSSRTGSAGEWKAFFQETDTTVAAIKVQAGDTIDFAVDCGADWACDVFEWIVDLKLVDADKRVVGVRNSAKDFRVIPAKAPAGETALREPVRNKAVWIPLENYATVMAARPKSAQSELAQLVAQYSPSAAPPTTPPPLTLKPTPTKPPGPFGDPSPPETPVIKKSPVPPAAAIAKAKAEILKVFGDDWKAAKTPPQKQELAQKIFDLVKDNADPATRFALLEDVRRLAVEGRASELAMQAMEMQGEQFEVDLLSLKVKFFESVAAEGLTPAQRGAALSAACELGYEALDADKFESLQAIVAIARSMAVKATTPESRAEAKEFFDAFAKKQKQVDAIKRAEQTLATAPNEPGANLVLGLHHFFTRGDAKKGLPLLAKGSDPKLAAAAKAREANLDKGVASSLEEADAWFDAIVSVPADHKADVERQALEGYTLLATSGTGLEKIKAEKRRDQLTMGLGASPDKGAAKKLRLKDLPATSPGMVGRVLIDGRDAGVLLTHEPPRTMDSDRLTQILANAKGSGGRIILEGILECPTAMSVKFEHRGRSNGPLQVVSVDSKQISTLGGSYGRFAFPTLQLAAGKHLVQWVCDFDGSNTPELKILDDGGGGGRQLSLYFTREQSYEARKRTTKSEVNLSK